MPFLLAALVVVGLALRLPAFGDSLFGDEVGAFYDVSGHGLGRVIYLLRGHSPELNPPLYFVVAWICEQLFGTSVQSLRLISLISGVATIPLTYLLGRWTAGLRAGLAAAAIVAVCPFLIFYSTEARPYGLLALLCVLSTLALIKAIQTGSWGWWGAYAAVSCAAMYTHFTCVFLLIAQFGWAFVTQAESRKGLIAANAAAAIGYLPWLPTLIDAGNSPGTKVNAALDPFTLHAVRFDLGRFWIGSPMQPISTIPGRVSIGLALAGLAVAAVGAVMSREERLPRPSPGVTLVALITVAVPVGIALYSSVRPSVWNSRNLICSWPAFAVLLGAGLTYPRVAWRTPALALVFAAFAIGSVKVLAPKHQRPDYRAAADYVTRTSGGHEPVVGLPDFTPGPPTEVEVAMDLSDPSHRHPVLRLGTAPLAAVLRAPPYTKLLPQRGEVVAREAVRLAGAGKLFLVSPGPVPIDKLEAARRAHVTSRPTDNSLVLLAAFLGALPRRSQLVSSHTYPGLHRVSVYAFQPR